MFSIECFTSKVSVIHDYFLVLVQIPCPADTSSNVHSKPGLHSPKQLKVISHPHACPSSMTGKDIANLNTLKYRMVSLNYLQTLQASNWAYEKILPPLQPYVLGFRLQYSSTSIPAEHDKQSAFIAKQHALSELKMSIDMN